MVFVVQAVRESGVAGIGKCGFNDSLFVEFSNLGDKCSMNFSFVGLCGIVGKRFAKRALTSLPSPPESDTRAIEHFQKTRRKNNFVQNQAYFDQLNGRARPSQNSHFVF